MRRFFAFFLSSLCVCLAGQSAFASSVHYRALEEIFGEPVTLSATGSPLRASDVVANMTIISRDEIRRSHSRNLATIIGDHVAGIDVLQTGRAGFDVGVRGYQRNNQPRLLVLIDGRQVFIDDYSRTIWEGLPVNLDDIQQIEVVKGPSSALFGSNAIGGVVNIITSNPLFDRGSVASVSLGSNGLLSMDATASVQEKRLYGVKLSAGGMDAQEFNTARFAREDATKLDPRRRYVSGRGLFALAPKLVADSSFSYTQGQETQTTFNHALFGEKFLTYSAQAGVSWDSPFGALAQTNSFNRSRTTAHSSEYFLTSVMNTDLFVSQLEDQMKINADHTVVLGGEYRFKRFSHDYAHPSVNPQKPVIGQDNFVARATWHWAISDTLAWTNALRYDHFFSRQDGVLPLTDPLSDSDYSRAHNDLSVNSGVVYKPTSVDSFRVSYGRGLQMPSMMQLGWSLSLPRAGYYVDVVGNPHLKPSIAQNYEIGYERKIDSLFSVVDFSTYYQLNQDVAGIVLLPGFFVHNAALMVQAKTVNVGNSHAWGAEIALRGKHPSGVKWDSSYSFSRVADSEGVAALLNYRGSAPVHHVRLGLGYQTGAWEVDSFGHYLSDTDMLRRPLNASLRVPTNSYFTLGARVGYQVNEMFSVALASSQLNQARLSANPYPALERQILFSVTGRF